MQSRGISRQEHDLRRYRQNLSGWEPQLQTQKAKAVQFCMQYNRGEPGLSVAVLLVLQCYPCQDEEHDEKVKLNAQVLPFRDAVLRQPIILQELQHRRKNVCVSRQRRRSSFMQCTLYSVHTAL